MEGCSSLQAGQGTDTVVSPEGCAQPAQEPAAAHQGFLARSQRVPVELLYIRARQQGKRLVLCGMPAASVLLATLHRSHLQHPCQRRGQGSLSFGSRSRGLPVCVVLLRQWRAWHAAGHSLGGAVAKLCTLRLLHQLDSREAARGHVKCVAFAAPALGNAALATLVLQQDWSHAFYNLTLPGVGCLRA